MTPRNPQEPVCCFGGEDCPCRAPVAFTLVLGEEGSANVFTCAEHLRVASLPCERVEPVVRASQA